MRTLLAVLSLGVAAGLATAQAQPQPQPTDPKPPPARQARDSDPAAFRARLERMLEEGKRRQEQIQAALKRLDAGEPSEQVQKDVEGGMRPRMGDRGPGFRGREGPGGHEGSPDQRARQPVDNEAVLAFLDQHNPELAKRIRDARAKSPEEGERLLGRLGPHIREALAERDPETKELRIADLKNGWELLGAMRAYREAVKATNEEDKARAVTQLRALAGNHFDLQIKLQEREVAMLEQRLTKLRQDLVDDRGRREEIIARRVDQMLNWGRRGDGGDKPGDKPKPDDKNR
jgi:hypothetical protein